jgi:NDP-sugar pyrophosphorylase family protein
MMSVFRNAGQWDASNVRIDGDRVVFYDKKAPVGAADFIDYGLSVFTREIITRYADAPQPLDLAVVQGDLVASDELAAYEVTRRFYEIGKPEGWAELDALLRREDIL